MRFELISLKKLDTLDIAELPSGRKITCTEWVSDLKKDGKVKVARHKVRLAARGFSQISRVDFTKFYSPVSKYTTIRFIFALSVHYGWHRLAIDIKNSFINVPFKELLNGEQLKGFKFDGLENNAYHLSKSLCGLRQASKECSIYLDSFPSNMGCELSRADPNLYLRKDGV